MREFKDLTDRAKAAWSDEAHEIYRAAKISFAQEVKSAILAESSPDESPTLAFVRKMGAVCNCREVYNPIGRVTFRSWLIRHEGHRLAND